MIYFPPLRTRRLAVQLRELSIGDAIAIGNMPEKLEQAATTAFLRAAVGEAGGIADPLLWTVQERILAVAHYLVLTADDGPDFSIGEARYSHYADMSSDCPDAPVLLGELAGDAWSIRHLTGHAAEAIERTEGDIGLTGRNHWVFGAMAAQLVREGEDCQEQFADEWLVQRMNVLAAFPESNFIHLMGMFYAGLDKLGHLFRLGFDYHGIHCLPNAQAEREGLALPPARFPAHAGLSAFSRLG